MIVRLYYSPMRLKVLITIKKAAKKQSLLIFSTVPYHILTIINGYIVWAYSTWTKVGIRAGFTG